MNEWLTGKKTPNLDQLFVIAEFHEIGLDKLFERVPPGLARILPLHQHLKMVMQALGEVLPDEWDESDLQAWEEYKGKQARAAARKKAKGCTDPPPRKKTKRKP